MNHIIEQQFNKVRETYYPLWDRKREWKLLTLDTGIDSMGVCCSLTKTVVIPEKSLLGTESQLRQLIIHEIAHAVANTGHGICWRNRIQKAALKAESLNEIEVAKGLREEIEWYSDPDNEPRIPVSIRYDAIKMLVFDNPEMSFEEVVNMLGITLSYEDFLKSFKRSQKVYEQAKRFRMKFTSREEAWDVWLEKHPETILYEDEWS
ncbi:MAG: hypothetical protein ACLPVO_09405 [Desulfomonilaceae bacterium]